MKAIEEVRSSHSVIPSIEHDSRPANAKHAAPPVSMAHNRKTLRAEKMIIGQEMAVAGAE